MFIAVRSVLAADYTVVIRGGRVVDGTGNPAYFADVAVRDGKIAAVGKLSGAAQTEIEANGMIVAPGFIDVHTHAEDIAEVPLAENFVRMGVTTIVTGNCGSSALDVAEFFRLLEATGVSVNVATLIGHNSIRSAAMNGSFDRVPTAAEVATMKSFVVKAMKDGAVGLSTGLIYLPGTFAKTEEIIELAKVVAASEGIYASHLRSESAEIFTALEELFRIAREARVRAQLSHLKLATKPVWGQADKVLAALEQARASGLDITQDQYVYAASSTGFSMLVPEWARQGGPDKFRERMRRPAEKAQVIAEMKDKLHRGQREDYAYAVIADYLPDRTLNGLTIVEAAKVRRGSDSLDDQIELILDLEQQGGATGVFHGISEEDLRKFLAHPNTMIGSDSGVRRFGEGVPHPRGYGNNARVLARYVRELKLLRLEDAIRRMTSLPATTYRLKDRGQLREGAWADIVVFDPETVQDNATYKEPHQYPSGIQYVFVNGVLVAKNGQHTLASPGRPLRQRLADSANRHHD
jgi:N-acyl-D-amino-acid deacylase